MNNPEREGRRFRAALAFASCFLAASFHTQAKAPCADHIPFKVRAEHYWAETGIQVAKGHGYRVEVVEMSGVKDWFLPVRDLKGWPRWAELLYSPFFWTRRQPLESWFALIATVDRNYPHRLRANEIYVAPMDGELVCYFNDAPYAYGNNRGIAELKLVPINVSKQNRKSPSGR